MLLQTQIRGVVVRLVICVCSLMGFTSAAKCVPEKCGSMNVSYPFWIKNSDCGYPGFNIACMEDKDSGMMAPYLSAFFANNTYINLTSAYYKIWEIDYSGYIVISSRSLKAFSCLQMGKNAFNLFQLPMPGPFTISMSNKFVVVGCNSEGKFSYYGEGGGEARCIAACVSQSDPPYCRYGCCEITLPDNWQWFYQWFYFKSGGIFYSNGEAKCGFSTILDPTTLRVGDNTTNLFWGNHKKADYGLRLNWGIGDENCSSCSIRAECLNSPSGQGYVCRCLPGYKGNGYSKGTDCRDIDECRNKSLNTCVEPSKGGVCHNMAGSYNCSCAKGYTGDGVKNGTACTDINECNNKSLNACVEKSKGGECRNLEAAYNCSCAKGYNGDGFKNGSMCEPESSNKTAMFAATGSVSSFVGVSIGVLGLVLFLRMRYQKQARDEYFRCNGGFLLERILAEKGKQKEGEKFRIFPENELKRASRDYSDDMKLGTGGSSTVYKGILSNGTAVAIKKFKEFPIGVESEEAMNQFINEIVILSGLNHKNVVKLVGCCLQTQSPVLVYEFVDGGTISHQLHSGHLTWQNRLQIAMGSAEAFAYLHSELDRPIIHRDVKSTNILLDYTVTPKVADFGISRLLCGTDTHLTTNTMGTCGYMDPEYYEMGTLTEKSDVYSFGVFLAELLTGRDPLSPGRPPQEIILSKFFISKCKDDCLTDILDPNMKSEENLNQMTAVASLARECLCPEGKERPTMKEVKMKLEKIGGSTRLAISTSCLNVVSDHISSETHTESTTSLFQLTEMSRMQGR